MAKFKMNWKIFKGKKLWWIVGGIILFVFFYWAFSRQSSGSGQIAVVGQSSVDPNVLAAQTQLQMAGIAQQSATAQINGAIQVEGLKAQVANNQIMAGADATKYTAMLAAQTQQFNYTTQQNIAGINAQYEIATATIARDTTLGTAQIAAGMQTGLAQIAANQNMSIADMAAKTQISLASLQAGVTTQANQLAASTQLGIATLTAGVTSEANKLYSATQLGLGAQQAGTQISLAQINAAQYTTAAQLASATQLGLASIHANENIVSLGITTKAQEYLATLASNTTLGIANLQADVAKQQLVTSQNIANTAAAVTLAQTKATQEMYIANLQSATINNLVSQVGNVLPVDRDNMLALVAGSLTGTGINYFDRGSGSFNLPASTPLLTSIH